MAVALWAWLVVCAWAGMPVESVSYTVDVVGPLAEVTIRQVFVNDGPEPIEAVYVFPMHEEAAVDRLTMRIGDRVIEGRVLERNAAVTEYTEALDEGFTAALTTQQRPNVFTQSVGNLPPGQRVEVELRSVQPVPHLDGAYQLVIPLVVMPRFVRPDELEATIQGLPSSRHERPTWTPPMAPDGTPLRATIDVALDAGLPFTEIRSTTHPIALDEIGPHVRALTTEVAMDQDFALSWSLAADRPEVAAFVQSGHALLTLEPPEAPPREHIVPRELIWVIDQSCSMSGTPMELVKEAMLEALQHVDERDSLRILRFNDRVRGHTGSVPATPRVKMLAEGQIRSMDASGGTYLLEGVGVALDTPSDPTRERYVMFLTDGGVSNDTRVLASIADKVGNARLFAFGVGPAPNRWLLDEMSRFGGGKTTWIRDGESPEEVVRRFVDTIDRPVLTDVVVDWGDWVVEEPWPRRLPALYAGQPLLITARVIQAGTTPIVVRGRLGDGTFERVIQPEHLEPGRSIPSTWARQKIANLERDQVWGEDRKLAAEILETSLEYQVMSQYVAFLAVDRTVRVKREGPLETEVQPNARPAGAFEDEVTYERNAGVEEITVEAHRDPINTEDTSTSDVLTKDLLSRLPTGRSYQAAVALSAGVTGGGANISGGAANETTYLLDGANITDPVTGTFSVNFNFDAIEQIEVLLGGYLPEHPTSLGGIVNLVTENGTNNLEFATSVFYSNGNWRPKMDERITADGLTLAPNGFDSEFQLLQVTSKVAGPLLRDKAWFVVSYQHDRSILANTGVPQTRDYDAHYVLSKVTVQPGATHRFTALLQLQPTTIDNIDQGTPYQRAEAQGRQVQGGLLTQARWQWFFSPDVNLETQITTQKLFLEVNAVPCTHDERHDQHPCEPGELQGNVDWETPGRIGVGGAFNSVNYGSFTFDDRWRYTAASKLSLVSVQDPLGGEHDIKLGIEGDQLVWDQIQGYNGNTLFVDTNVVPFDPLTLESYYWVEVTGPIKFRTSGSTWAAFAQDSWKPVGNLTVNYGTRLDSFVMRNDLGEPVLSGTLLGPRLHAAWDPWSDQRTKIATGYGRFNDTGRLGVASFLSGANYGSHLYLGEYFDGNGFPTGYLNNTANDYATDPPGNLATSAELQSPRVDEIILNVERVVVEDFALKSHMTGRFVRSQYEYDELNLIFDSDGSAVIGSRIGDATLTLPRLRTPILAKRDYFRWDLIAHKVKANRWEAQATYSYTNSIGSTTQALSGSFANDAQTQFNYGPLNTDIRHVVKSFGYWDLPTDPWTQTVGATFEYYGGFPEERLYVAENLGSGFAEQALRIRPRGTYLRFNPYWTAGLRFIQTIDVRKGRLQVDLAATNLFDNKAPEAPDFGYLDANNRLITLSRQDPLQLQAGLRYEF